MTNLFYETSLGKYYLDRAEDFINSEEGAKFHGRVQLLITSPPFPLNKKKKYGNLKGEEYRAWFSNLSEAFSKLLTDDGSIVIEMGNSWEAERPVYSTLHLESLLGFLKNQKANLNLCQEFICYNPSRLPSPAQWVTVNRFRTIDSYTHVWWMSKSDTPKADNSKVLRPYSASMKRLLKKQKYNSGKRPSEHDIGETSFLKDNGGSIMPNVLEIEQIDETRERRVPGNIFSISNTNSSDFFLKACRERGITPHPARMPLELVQFFVEFLTDKGDLVFDPFAGSNTTGFIAEKLERNWVATEVMKDYGEQSMVRFEDPNLDTTLSKK
ncbi:site-specific DNA-methyltransferase [Aquibacillus sp. 3ASR75-11]|uniref:Methyltransferase n=1 Tax=Terrihalobacillus insolitus TaxID=2950438 RepID=A0A9X4AMV2_9BACI|nr:site-specific DNA-methyltransferase [Terrihalobacillus insolitus]MDC3415105.1 site-specific DNA-methyltransferase [Terrihalobacillus insolitus]MDC3425827.1 site-specific DNA-methyltransferase [Terrihalobacillus insolitus]